MDIEKKAKLAKEAQLVLSSVKSEIKNSALEKISILLNERKSRILEANQIDLERAKKQELAPPLLKRLKFNEKKIQDVCTGLEALIALDDPVGITLKATELDNGLELYKISTPIGVIGVIFESRPDALIQISTLCLKSGNAVLLKGGSEAKETNIVLFEIIKEATTVSGIPEAWICLLETRSDVKEMLNLYSFIDLVIPRGSNDFVRFIIDNSRIPVLGHADGICHVYVDKGADIEFACNIIEDSKCQYVAVCNAAETLLVHSSIAEDLLPKIKTVLEKHSVELRGCERTKHIIPVKDATDVDWYTEYLDYILSIKIVDSLEQAVSHINKYGSGHTDSIVTSNREQALKFIKLVDSADVFLNCSTRFADGYRYGLGAEVGISTNKIHARGPVGMEGLLIYKWVLLGNGHIVADYVKGSRKFTHKPMKKKFQL